MLYLTLFFFSQLESIYRSATFVKNLCIYASPTRSKPLAIIIPNLPALKLLAQEEAVAGNRDIELLDSEEKPLTSNQQIQQLALQHLQALGRDAALASFEIIEGLVLTRGSEEWTPTNVSFRTPFLIAIPTTRFSSSLHEQTAPLFNIKIMRFPTTTKEKISFFNHLPAPATISDKERLTTYVDTTSLCSRV